ncbi:MAG: hypothetical protein QM784_15375 [Polyangiaceae bacterium]
MRRCCIGCKRSNAHHRRDPLNASRGARLVGNRSRRVDARGGASATPELVRIARGFRDAALEGTTGGFLRGSNLFALGLLGLAISLALGIAFGFLFFFEATGLFALGLTLGLLLGAFLFLREPSGLFLLKLALLFRFGCLLRKLARRFLLGLDTLAFCLLGLPLRVATLLQLLSLLEALGLLALTIRLLLFGYGSTLLFLLTSLGLCFLFGVTSLGLSFLLGLERALGYRLRLCSRLLVGLTGPLLGLFRELLFCLWPLA